MIVYVFQSSDHTVAVTPVEEGNNLPTNFGKWELVKIIDMQPGDVDWIGLNSEQALLDIQTNGYHLTRNWSADGERAP